MLLDTVAKLLPYYWKAGLVPFIWGEHGIGKSETVRRVCEKLGYNFLDVRLGLKEVGDLLGMIRGFDEHGRAEYSVPDWWPLHSDSKPTVIFWDEFNRATVPVLQATFQIILDNAIGQHKLPPNVFQVAAGNPDGHGYNVTDLEDALASRFCHCFVTTEDDAEFFQYMKNFNVDKTIQTFLVDYPQLVGSQNLPTPLEVKPSRRAWTFASRLRQSEIPINLLGEALEGIIGPEATAAYMKSLRALEEPVRGIEVLDHYHDKKELRKRVIQFSDPKNLKAAILNITAEEIGENINHEGDHKRAKSLTEQQLKNIGQFLKDVPMDITFAFATQFCRDHDQVAEYVSNDDEIREKVMDASTAKRLQQDSNDAKQKPSQ